MGYENIRYAVADKIATILLDHEQALNALDIHTVMELSDAFDRCEKDPNVSVVVLGAMGRTFCVGCNVKQFEASFPDTALSVKEISERLGRVTIQMKKMSKPIIVAVQGAAAGGGANLALAGDIVYMSDDAKLLQAYVGIGLAPDTCGAYWLPRMIGSSRAFELFITGRPVLADEAKQLGLILDHVPADSLLEAAMSCAGKLAAGPCVTYKAIKQMMYKSLYQGAEAFLESEMHAQAETAHSQDFVEGVHAFVEKRKPDFKGK